MAGTPNGHRNLVQFRGEDAEALIGRPITDHEYRTIVKILEHSIIAEVFAECVDAAIEEDGDG